MNPPEPPDLGNYLDRETTVHVVLMDTFRDWCVGPDPFFHFEADSVTPEAQPALFALAACMKTGARASCIESA